MKISILKKRATAVYAVTFTLTVVAPGFQMSEYQLVTGVFKSNSKHNSYIYLFIYTLTLAEEATESKGGHFGKLK